LAQAILAQAIAVASKTHPVNFYSMMEAGL